MKDVIETVSAKRVRRNTSADVNEDLDQEILQRIEEAQNMDSRALSARIAELDKEWDVERALELNASILALSGTCLGALVNKKWFILPGVVTAFLMQHALQGWCPPLPILRKLGYRTRQEIDEEIMALKVLRGDFKEIPSDINAADLLSKIRS